MKPKKKWCFTAILIFFILLAGSGFLRRLNTLSGSVPLPPAKAFPFSLITKGGKKLFVSPSPFIFFILFILYTAFLLLLFLLSHNKQKKELQKYKNRQTELENTNKQLRLEIANLKNASLAKSEFLSRLSHEIRTPLHVVVGISSLLSSHAIEEKKMDDYLKQIHSSSAYLLSLINDVMDLSAMESEKTKQNNRTFLLPSMLSMVKLICQHLCQEKNITLRFDSHSLAEPCLYGDEQKLKQVLINLVSNAIKFSPENGTVDLLTEQTLFNNNKTQLRFTIHDNGRGIEKSFMDKLFLPFEQAPSVRNSNLTGLGLGLSISKNLIELLNGSIHAESEPGSGTTFTVTVLFQTGSRSELEQPRQSLQKTEEKCLINF